MMTDATGPEFKVGRFIWQFQPADAEHPFKWDVKWLEMWPHRTRPGEFDITYHDAMTPEMMKSNFGLTKSDVKKVVDPFLIVEAGKLRAQLAHAHEEAASAAETARQEIARQRAVIAEKEEALVRADKDLAALAAELEAARGAAPA